MLVLCMYMAIGSKVECSFAALALYKSRVSVYLPTPEDRGCVDHFMHTKL